MKPFYDPELHGLSLKVRQNRKADWRAVDSPKKQIRFVCCEE